MRPAHTCVEGLADAPGQCSSLEGTCAGGAGRRQEGSGLRGAAGVAPERQRQCRCCTLTGRLRPREHLSPGARTRCEAPHHFPLLLKDCWPLYSCHCIVPLASVLGETDIFDVFCALFACAYHFPPLVPGKVWPLGHGTPLADWHVISARRASLDAAVH